MSKIRSFIAALVVLVFGGISSWLLVTSSSPILVSNPTITVNENAGSSLPVYMTLENSAGPNRLLGVKSPQGKMTMLMGASQTGGLAIPASSRPLLAADGAHIMVSGIDPKIADGSFVPLILSFETGGDVPVQAVVRRTEAQMSDMKRETRDSGTMSQDMHMNGRMMDVKSGQPAPEITLSVDPVADGREWQITINTQNFEFLRVEGMAEHKAGQGHAHLYLNGLKLQRMYGNSATVGALPVGKHIFNVTLNTNDHRSYSVVGKPIRAEAQITAN